jgi:hypothetical protein
MLTIFTIPKAFRGHIGVIQRNAIQSWMRVHPEADIVLFGDDEGTAEAAREFGLRHVGDVERNEFGSILVNATFSRAQAMARHDVMCYVNCDIILMDDFRSALERVRAAYREFLMVGRRWDVDLTAALEFSDDGWRSEVRGLASRSGKQRPAQWIDYFAFSRGLYGADVPAFAIGRTSWDNWLVWKALDSKKAVVDASPVVMAVHQNHDYSHHPQGEHGAWHGAEAQANQRLMGANEVCTVGSATYRLRSDSMPRNYEPWLVKRGRKVRSQSYALWFAFLDFSRPLRHKMGLRQKVRT